MASRNMSRPSHTPSNASLTDLPTEVRQRIYQDLFCTRQQPVLLSRRRNSSQLFARPDPVFHTGLFRVNKQIHQDTVAFAYGFNSFQVRQDFGVLRGLGQTARRAIRDLTIYPTMWHQESQDEAEMWQSLAHLTALQRLKVWCHPEVLYPAIPYLSELREVLCRRGQRPSIALDLCIWEKHLSFDMDRLDYERSHKLITQGSGGSGEEPVTGITPRQQVMRLPTQAAEVVIFGDISAAAARALDDYLQSLDISLLAKSIIPMPLGEYNGRSQRLWYRLELD